MPANPDIYYFTSPECNDDTTKSFFALQLAQLLVRAGWPSSEAQDHSNHELNHALATNLPGKYGVITDENNQKIIATFFRPTSQPTADQQFEIAIANPEDMSDEDMLLMIAAYKQRQ